MSQYTFDYSINFLGTNIKIPESYFDIILDKNDILQPIKVEPYPANKANTRNINKIRVQELPYRREDEPEEILKTPIIEPIVEPIVEPKKNIDYTVTENILNALKNYIQGIKNANKIKNTEAINKYKESISKLLSDLFEKALTQEDVYKILEMALEHDLDDTVIDKLVSYNTYNERFIIQSLAAEKKGDLIEKLIMYYNKKDLEVKTLSELLNLALELNISEESIVILVDKIAAYDKDLLNKPYDTGRHITNTNESKQSKTLLEYAIMKKYNNLLKTLLTYGVDVNRKHLIQDVYYDYTPLLFAIYFNPNVVKLLLEYGANANAEVSKEYMYKYINVTILGHCIKKLLQINDVTTLKLLLDFKADPNSRDPETMTVLMLSAQKFNYPFVKTLIDYGARKEETYLSSNTKLYPKEMTAYDIFIKVNGDFANTDTYRKIEALII